MKLQNIIFWSVVLIVFVSIVVLLFLTNDEIPKDKAKCIGENSILFINENCPHCESQKEMFGENVKYLKIEDCTKFPMVCIQKEITRVPSWEINDKTYKGVQSFNNLMRLTGC